MYFPKNNDDSFKFFRVVSTGLDIGAGRGLVGTRGGSGDV